MLFLRQRGIFISLWTVSSVLDPVLPVMFEWIDVQASILFDFILNVIQIKGQYQIYLIFYNFVYESYRLYDFFKYQLIMIFFLF